MITYLTTEVKKKKMSPENKPLGPGIIMPDGSFISKKSVENKSLKEGKATFITDMPLTRGFEYWGKRFEERQAQYQEADIRRDKVEIQFNEEPIINFMGDLHIGSPSTDYKRINAEIEIICNTPNSYLMVMGDTVDGFFFNPAQFEQMEQVPEQYKYINSIFEKVGKEKKLLIGWGGDHCKTWGSKSGLDPYDEFSKKFGAFYMHGVGYVTLKVGETVYNLVGAHRLPGSSIYNNTHPERRLSNDIQGADIYLGCHTHKKGYQEQEVKQFGGDSKLVSFISLGPYKSTDDYSRKLGFASQTDNGMYGCCIKLYKDHRQVKYYNSILEGNSKRLARIQEYGKL